MISTFMNVSPMRTLVYGFIFWCGASIAQADVPALDIAMEAGGIKVEFNSISKIGTVQVLRCELCTQTIYPFKQKPKIVKQGKSISFDAFMEDYWNAKYPTLILDKEDLTVLKIVY